MVNIKGSIVLITLIVWARVCMANTDQQLWFALVQQGRITKHWGYFLDIQHRTKNQFLNNLHTELFRVGATYYVNNDLRVTAGYAFVLGFPSLNNQSFFRPEHRPWQQVFHVYTNHAKNLRLINYLRTEQRLLRKTAGETLAEGHIFRLRFRYSIMMVALFNKKEFKQGSVGLVLNDEVFVTAYSADKVKAFDQNRAFAGLAYNITDALQLHAGYLNIFAFTPKGNEIVHGIRVTAFHNISWAKK
ncbi:MAG: DUF2490 domain-containing protein [Chitinophagales bacterium]|nr:DUF2490 domain-containing protein [Chitinophagales bacterium]